MRHRSFALLILLVPACSSPSTPAADLAVSADQPLLADHPAALERVATPERVPDSAAPACPSFAAPVALGKVESAQISEASGLIASRTNTDVFWTHNDSGDTARVFAFNRAGKHLGIYALAGVTANDWEDIASGPGPVSGKEYLYLGDFGDNSTSRSSVAVYRVEEPVVSSTQAPLTAQLSGVDTLALKYPDGAHNAETLLVDPRTGDLYIVTKSSDGASGVYRSAAPHDTAATRTLTKVASLSFGAGELATTGTLATGGDISPDGSEIAIRTYGAAVLWKRGASATVADALAGPPCLLSVAAEIQGEALSFDAQKSYYTLSEGLNPSLYYFARK
jgi:hypothetical protein